MTHNSKKQTINLSNWKGINPFVNIDFRTGEDPVRLSSPDAFLRPLLFVWGWFDIYEIALNEDGSLDLVVPKWFWSQYRGSAPVVNIDLTTPDGMFFLGYDGDGKRYYAIPKGAICTPSGSVTYNLSFPDKYGALNFVGATESTYVGSIFNSAVPGWAFKGRVTFDVESSVVIDHFDPRDRYSYFTKYLRAGAERYHMHEGLFRSVGIFTGDQGYMFSDTNRLSWQGVSFVGELVAIPGEGQFTNQVTVFNVF